MDDIGSEVSHKIRAAIKAKLIELGAYVDDELPDYIMVMVANKKTKAQMDEDLQLFLLSNTKIFTSWLHTVLQKLQEVTVANFDAKKDSDPKSSKRKKSESEDRKSRKSSEESLERVRKHSKKRKMEKKSKKNKHKERDKVKKSDREDSREKEKEKDKERDKEKDKDREKEKEKKRSASQEIILKDKKIEPNDSFGIMGDVRKTEKVKGERRETDLDDEMKISKEDGNDTKKDGEDVVDKPSGANVESTTKKPLVLEDEDDFNIEPLKPIEKDRELSPQTTREPVPSTNKKLSPTPQLEKNVSVPTLELLKQHDKIQNEQFESSGREKPKSESEVSLPPEEIRKQLLLSRAKKKFEESKKADRMRSNSPDVWILEEISNLGGRQKDFLSSSSKQQEHRSPRSTHSGGRGSSRGGSPGRSKLRSSFYSDRSHSLEKSPFRKDYKSKTTETKTSNKDRMPSSSSRRESSPGKSGNEASKKNIIKISESLPISRTEVRKDMDLISREKNSSKRPVSSRVVPIPDPEMPEISSIVKVKPREYVSKDKQANKTLILKAVADAEKSIATTQTRPEIESESKVKALYTKKLREKRYGKLAVTLSNLRSSDTPDRYSKNVFVDSNERLHSDLSDEGRNKSELFSKKLSKYKNQFISSKASLKEKNEKYIRCWLEGVEKAVKEDEMVNPHDIDDFVHSKPTDEENNEGKEVEWKRKRKSFETSTDISTKTPKLSEEEIINLGFIPNPSVTGTEPQIVVTLDGLDSKAIQSLIMKNKESGRGPLLTSLKKTGVTLEKNSEPIKVNFEKISDRFGRLNRVNEDDPNKGEQTTLVSQSSGGDKVPPESKNRQLIALLSEKFGKIDREFEERKRKRSEDNRRCTYDPRRNDKEDNDRNGRHRKSDRRYLREGGFGLYRRS